MAKSLASCIQGMPSSDEEEKAQLLSPSSKSSHSATKNSRKMNDEKDLQYALDLLALEHMEVTDEWTRRGESRQTAFDMEREELEFITRTLLEKKARSRYCPLEPFDAEMPKQLERLEFRLREVSYLMKMLANVDP